MLIKSVMVCWSLPIIVPVTAARGRIHIASMGLICRGLVQMAFWSKRILFGVPRKVIGAGFGGSAGPAGESLCGSGASGRDAEVSAATTLWAEQNRTVFSRSDAARKRDALSLGSFTGTGS